MNTASVGQTAYRNSLIYILLNKWLKKYNIIIILMIVSIYSNAEPNSVVSMYYFFFLFFFLPPSEFVSHRHNKS